MWAHVQRTNAARVAGLLAACASLLMLGALIGTEPALAQDSCGDGVIEVATTPELNDAIACHNRPAPRPDVQITLTRNIDVWYLSGDALVTPIGGSGELIIDGGGFRIRRDTDAGFLGAPVLALVGEGKTELLLINLEIEVGPYDTAGILHQGAHELRMISIAITAPPFGTPPSGIVSTGDAGSQLSMSSSSIDGVPIGIELQTPIYYIDTSTINSTGVDIALRGEDGSGGISNSTLGGPIGIEFNTSVVQVENSTILGDAALPGDAAGAEGAVTYTSSIINTCSSDQIFDSEPGPGWVDLGNNTGGCFGPQFEVPLWLADNGCERATPAGCPLTAPITDSSTARNVGLCSPIQFGENDRDQRGQLRTPPGPGCDAGAYEYGCGPSGGSFDVSSELEFTAAIECLNVASDPDTVLTIELQGDIEAETVTAASVLTTITQPLEVDLIIEGNGYTLRRSASAPNDAAPVLTTAATSATRVQINDLSIDVGPSDTHGIEILGDSSLHIQRIAIVATAPESSATGILLSGGQDKDTTIANSIIDGMRVGVHASDGLIVGIFGTTITSSEIDVLSDDAPFVSIAISTLTAPIGLELGTNIHYLAYSTVLGDGAATGANSTGSVNAISSIINSCSAPVGDINTPRPAVVDRGGNVGGCFNPGQTIDTELADNGCLEATPIGCPRTVALAPNSPALMAGDCRETEGGLVDTDQRGEPRTPVGAGCDAGAFESDAATPGDVTNNGVVDNADVLALLAWLAGGPEPVAMNAGDLTGDGFVQLDDALTMAQLVAI